MLVTGLDGCKSGWVGVLLDEGRFAEAGLFSRAEDVLSRWSAVEVIAIDIPIGLPDASTNYRRDADTAARAFLKGSASSVFSTPPREVLEAPDHASAVARDRELCGAGISKQSYDLGRKILEVDGFAARESRVYEVHPEVSFRAMSGGKALGRKKSWNGLTARRDLLVSVGIEVPATLGPPGDSAPDDVVDAAAGAWSAGRIAAGQALTLPSPPIMMAGRSVAIYY